MSILGRECSAHGEAGANCLHGLEYFLRLSENMGSLRLRAALESAAGVLYSSIHLHVLKAVQSMQSNKEHYHTGWGDGDQNRPAAKVQHSRHSPKLQQKSYQISTVRKLPACNVFSCIPTMQLTDFYALTRSFSAPAPQF